MRLSQAAGKFQERCLFVRWIVTQRPCQRDHPATALDGKNGSPAFVAGRSSRDEQRLPVGRKLVGAAIDACGISNIDLDAALLHMPVPQRAEPLWCARTTPTGIYDEIGGQQFLALLSRTVSQQDTGDAVVVYAQLRNLAGVHDVHILPGY